MRTFLVSNLLRTSPAVGLAQICLLRKHNGSSTERAEFSVQKNCTPHHWKGNDEEVLVDCRHGSRRSVDADTGWLLGRHNRHHHHGARLRHSAEADIQNAQSDTAKYATIADQQLSKGCGVMLLVDYQGAGVAVAEKAKAQGVPVIAYDRPITGADYYVSFDNEVVGQMEGQMVLDGLAAAGKDPATASVIFSSGDPADGNAAMFLKGATDVLTSAGVKAAFTM